MSESELVVLFLVVSCCLGLLWQWASGDLKGED